MTTGKGLPAQLATGRVIHPDSPTYTKARTDWDGFYRSYPLVIVFAKTTEDVVNAITWSRQNDVAPRRAAAATASPAPGIQPGPHQPGSRPRPGPGEPGLSPTATSRETFADTSPGFQDRQS